MARPSIAQPLPPEPAGGIAFQAVAQLQLELAEQREPQALLDLACGRACALFDAAYAVAATTGGHGHTAFGGALPAGLAAPAPDQGWLAQVAAGGVARRLAVPDGLSERAGLPAGYPQINAALAAPIASARRAYGWLCLAARPGSHGFSAEQETALQIIGAQAGRVLEHIERQHQADERAERLRAEAAEREHTGQTMLRMLQRLEALRALDSEILAARSPREVARVGLDHLIYLVPYWGASVTMFDDTGTGMLVLAANATAPDSPYDPGTTLTPAQYGLDDLEVLRQGRVREAPDLDSVFERPPAVENLYRQGMRSYARVPMMVEGALVGVVNLGSDRTAFFTREQLDFARSIANQIGIATQQAALRERIARQAAELEQRVAERTAELKAASDEMEAFSYTVSHDLRAPLRAIDGFSRMLEQDYGGAIDDKGRYLLETIRKNSTRMNVLIDDLLKFAQLKRAHLSAAPIDMGALVREVWAEIGAGEAVEFHLAELPPAKGDRAMLKQVWVNLLDNACKYSGKRAHPVIEVCADEGEGGITYRVTDNGAGFDMRFYDKMFGVFQRLHSTQEFPGTGVGLAMVARVIARHGGRIWAEGAVDAGARFYFNLPRDGPKEAR